MGVKYAFLNTEKRRKEKTKTSSLPQSYFSRKGLKSTALVLACPPRGSFLECCVVTEERGELAGLSRVELRAVCFLMLLLLLLL